MAYPGCTCSEQQLYHVGCDCGAEIKWYEAPKATVHIWTDGYASSNQKTISLPAIASDDECREAARKAYPYGLVFRISRPSIGPVQQFDEKYIREMSKGG